MTSSYITGPGQPCTRIKVPERQSIAGIAIGILVTDSCYPLMPGNVANASSYNFPVLLKIMRGTTIRQVLSADPAVLENIVEAGKDLQQQGVRAIIGACGYFGNYQEKAAAALEIPVFMSSLLQVPIIIQSLKPEHRIGIICASFDSLTPETLSQCGINDQSRLVIIGAQDLPEFQNLFRCPQGFYSDKLEQEMIGLAKQFVADNPDIAAILLECSDMPPYAWAIQNAVKLPVFDYMTLINWVYQAVVRRPFSGFI